MRVLFVIVLLLLSTTFIVGCGGPENEARGVFKKFAAAVKDGKIDEAKKYIEKSTLAQIEKSGQAELFFKMAAEIKIDEMKATVSGDSITFRKEEKSGDGGTMSMEIKMVKEDGQWKLGAKENGEDKNNKGNKK